MSDFPMDSLMEFLKVLMLVLWKVYLRDIEWDFLKACHLVLQREIMMAHSSESWMK